MTPGVKPGTTPGAEGEPSEAVGRGAVVAVEAVTESVGSTAVLTVVAVVSGPGTVAVVVGGEEGVMVMVVRGKTVVSEDGGLEGLVGLEEDSGEDVEVVVGRDPGLELTAAAKTAIAAQKLLRLSLSSAAGCPPTVTMLIAALVLSASSCTLVDDSMETMLSWQLSVARQSWL